jgi:ribonucleotide monophosphatase NagD (HAD superfamily)
MSIFLTTGIHKRDQVTYMHIRKKLIFRHCKTLARKMKLMAVTKEYAVVQH